MVMPRIIRFGVGRIARRDAVKLADRLRERGEAARALFKVESGGWIVAVYGRLRQRRPRDG
jgi:hypothetical protein